MANLIACKEGFSVEQSGARIQVNGKEVAFVSRFKVDDAEEKEPALVLKGKGPYLHDKLGYGFLCPLPLATYLSGNGFTYFVGQNHRVPCIYLFKLGSTKRPVIKLKGLRYVFFSLNSGDHREVKKPLRPKYRKKKKTNETPK